MISVVPYLQTLRHVHVYSLSTDQWKKSRIGNNNIGSFYRRYRDMPFPARLVNGCAYFLEYPKTFGNDQVVAVIDLSHEIIRQIDVPHINDDHSFVFVKLGEHENSVAVMGRSSGSDLVMWSFFRYGFGKYGQTCAKEVCQTRRIVLSQVFPL